jgi:hypothetical protein
LIAVMTIEARAVEAIGRSALEQRRIIAQMLRQSGFRPQPPALAGPQKHNAATAGLDYLREAYGQRTDDDGGAAR